MARYETATAILQQVAPEVGLPIEANPYDSTSGDYIQLRALLNAAGRELVTMYPWEILRRDHSIVTDSGDSGDYALPSDFDRMIPQTHWDQTGNNLMGGETAQTWAYLEGTGLSTDTIYMSFMVEQNLFRIYPQPPPDAKTVAFKYISINWARDPTTGNAWVDKCSLGSDVIYFDTILISRYLKVKFLEAKGFDTTKAQDDFNQIFALRTGQNRSAPTLSIGRSRGSGMLINAYRNVPDTGYGL